MKTQYKIALMLTIWLLFASQSAFADVDMDVLYTIEYPDSTRVKTVTSVGDFNGDGYPDFLVSLGMQGVCLFYGGPDFDTQPDLIFYEDVESFGVRTCHLGDFNGDNIDDFAVSASSEHGVDYYTGKIYIFYGSTEPDTIADLIILGYRYCDYLGEMMAAGDFNGDGYGDAIAAVNDIDMGPRVYIYFGSDQPDTIPDMIYYYDGYLMRIEYLYAGSDLNGDGYDEYGWLCNDEWSGREGLMFLGNESLSQIPDFSAGSSIFIFLKSDISGDGIDDFMRSTDSWYLCLGDEPLDIDPDYYMWYSGRDPYMYNMFGLGPTILKHRSGYNKFIFYNTGVPFDTIPIAVFDFENEDIRPASGRLITEDINDDGAEEIITACYEVDIGTHIINIYSFIATDIEETAQNDNLPNQHQILSCYPNPFNSSTVISYSNIDGNDIKIYDLTGRLVKTFKCEGLTKGKITWNAIDDNGNLVTSGIYFVKGELSEHEISTKLIYLK